MAAPIAAVAAGAVAAGAGALMADKAKLKPAMGNYAGELQENLAAQEAVAPQKFALEAKYAPEYAKLTNALISAYGPDYVQAQRQAAGTDDIISKLLNQANTELDAGASMDPALAAEVQQSVRAAQAARGMGFGLPDVGVEAAVSAREMEALRRARQAFAMQTAGLASASAGGPGMVGAVTNQGPFFDPESQYAYGLNRTNQQAMQAANAFKANKQLAIGAGLMNMGGGMMGGGMGMMGGGMNWLGQMPAGGGGGRA